MSTWKSKEKRISRAKDIDRAERDLEFRQAICEKAKRDPVFFFNQFCHTYDPRPEAPVNHAPFLTYPFQDDYIRELEQAYQKRHDLLTEKSRDMGASWMILT